MKETHSVGNETDLIDTNVSRRSFLKQSSAVASGFIVPVGASTALGAKRRPVAASLPDRELIGLSATKVAHLLRSKKISPTELAQIAIQRVQTVNKSINAVIHLPVERVMAEAKLAEREIARGDVDWNSKPLLGVPITIKDSLDVKGMPTVCGVPVFRDNVAQEDATVVRKLRSAGAIVLGKTNLPALLMHYETGNSVFGVTNNPYDLSRTCGGSSGGEGAIVASGGSWLGIGTDGLGSIRLPAHCCGVAALRPGWGRVSRAGHVPPVTSEGNLPDPGLLSVGPFARYVEDVALGLSIIQGPDSHDPNTFPVPLGDYRKQNLRRLRIAVWTECEGTVLTDETANTLDNAAKALERMGMIVQRDKPPLADRIIDICSALYAPWFVDEWEAELKKHGVHQLDALDRDVMQGLRTFLDRVTADEVTAFQELLPDLRVGLLSFLEQYDAIISPVSATPAVKHGTTFHDPNRLVFLDPPSFVPGVPSGTVPCGFSDADDQGKRLPIGVQIVGRQFREDTVLAIMDALERRLGGWIGPPL